MSNETISASSSVYTPRTGRGFIGGEEPKPSMPRVYVHIDIETTGLDLLKHGIVQIASYATGEDENEFYGYFVEDANPLVDENNEPTGIQIEKSALDINGFTLDRIEAADSIDCVLARWAAFIVRLSTGQPLRGDGPYCASDERDVHLVFHNAKFDVPRIEIALSRANLQLQQFRRVLCTISLGFLATGKVMSLAALADHYGVRNLMAHDAFSDALTTGKVFHAIKGSTGKLGPILSANPVPPVTGSYAERLLSRLTQ